ncbi:MAG: hypothetical protein JWQ72_2680 [Polaromonas sp.]|nr:hypothetical protein [Polaromonas sp.]
MKRFFKIIVIAAVAGAALAGCSGMRIVDSDVTAFPAWTSAPPGPNTPYRFERLPSQQLPAMQQDRIEEIARSSLARVGMVLDPNPARFSVQVVLNTQVVQRYPNSAFGYGGPGVFLGAGNLGSSVGLSFPIGFGEPYYQRELRITMRELSSQKVVFETRALHDGPWGDAFAVLPAMVDAALMGFPQPPVGTRRVNVEIPR